MAVYKYSQIIHIILELLLWFGLVFSSQDICYGFVPNVTQRICPLVMSACIPEKDSNDKTPTCQGLPDTGPVWLCRSHAMELVWARTTGQKEGRGHGD